MAVGRDWPIQARMAALAALIGAVLCAVTVGIFPRYSYAVAAERQVRDAYTAVLHLVHAYAHEPVPAVVTSIGDTGVQVVDPAGHVVASTRSLAGRPRMASFVPPARSDGEDHVVCDIADAKGCMVVAALWVPAGGGDLLAYGFRPAPAWYVSQALAVLVAAISLAWVSFVAGGAYLVVYRALLPVEGVCRELTEITATDLSRRVPVPACHDQTWGLATIVNQTLHLLETAFQRERRFTSDASHDLRNPITGMQVQLEEAMMDGGGTDWPATARTLMGGLQRLQAIVADLLVLSRLDMGAQVPAEPVELSRLVSGERAGRGRVKRLESDVQDGIMVTGDRMSLVRLLNNLLDNAERHAASTVTVILNRQDEHAQLMVWSSATPPPAPASWPPSPLMKRPARRGSLPDRPPGQREDAAPGREPGSAAVPGHGLQPCDAVGDRRVGGWRRASRCLRRGTVSPAEEPGHVGQTGDHAGPAKRTAGAWAGALLPPVRGPSGAARASHRGRPAARASPTARPGRRSGSRCRDAWRPPSSDTAGTSDAGPDHSSRSKTRIVRVHSLLAGFLWSGSTALIVLASATESPPATTGSRASASSLSDRSSGGSAVRSARIDARSSSSSRSWKSCMLSCSPLVMGRSQGWMMSRPFDFAAASATTSMSWSFRLMKSLYRLRSDLSTSSPATVRKKCSNLEIAITDMWITFLAVDALSWKIFRTAGVWPWRPPRPRTRPV
ncbi:hypothetical protein MF672_030865 [Actinomadura sp. ATCC 31491]|uniref:histidine kinase n=1 Tax=Actinomadura luzonensis TaxID=2805427 RepID=A0ABT0G0V0_9ACTN|nr:HAMP domain-containing sensor histidine kinase [Actinomadura luzonensis]MCK2218159.1 hypothetical protein [Actinomadura luzonensis]